MPSAVSGEAAIDNGLVFFVNFFVHTRTGKTQNMFTNVHRFLYNRIELWYTWSAACFYRDKLYMNFFCQYTNKRKIVIQMNGYTIIYLIIPLILVYV